MGPHDLSFIMNQFREHSWRVTLHEAGSKLSGDWGGLQPGGEGQETKDENYRGSQSESLGNFKNTYAPPPQKAENKVPTPRPCPGLIKSESLGKWPAHWSISIISKLPKLF